MRGGVGLESKSGVLTPTAAADAPKGQSREVTRGSESTMRRETAVAPGRSAGVPKMYANEGQGLARPCTLPIGRYEGGGNPVAQTETR